MYVQVTFSLLSAQHSASVLYNSASMLKRSAAVLMVLDHEEVVMKNPESPTGLVRTNNVCVTITAGWVTASSCAHPPWVPHCMPLRVERSFELQPLIRYIDAHSFMDNALHSIVGPTGGSV
jgi:hypothetical protein